MKTVLVNAYTAYNLGDDLFLKILVERYPEVQFRVIASPSYHKIFKRQKNVQITQPLFSLFTKIILKCVGVFSGQKKDEIFLNVIKKFYLSEYELSDGYIYIGGSLFSQHEDQIVLGNIINEVITNIFHDKPKFIVGANFGPYLTETYLEFHREMFRGYSDICFRELYSKNIFSNLSNVRFCPDIVFQLDLPRIDKEENSIGFSLIDTSWRKDLYTYENDYLKFVTQIIDAGINNGSNIYLFSFCKHEGDENVISKVISTIPSHLRNKINVVKYDGNIDAFLLQYSRVESMFTTRFHAMILSSLLDQNIFPLVYSEKMMNVLNDLNYQGEWSRISDLKSINYSECLKNIDGSRFKISTSIIEKSKDQFLVFDNKIADL